METYGSLQSIDEAMDIFSRNYRPDEPFIEAWAGIYLHWNDGYILVVNNTRLEAPPYPYQDATLHWEHLDGAWHISA